MPSTTDDPAIEARKLRKTYVGEVALRNLSLSISSGTIYGFLGPNGAGKTTTMRLLTGLAQPSSGQARVHGISTENRRELASLVGYLPETPPLYEEFSAREQLEYAADLRDIPAERATDHIDAYLQEVDLLEDANRRIDSYSKGMRQKTAFIQSVLHDPDVLFLDEPTSGLDPRAARRIREIVAAIADDGTTVFLSTHILSVVEAVADQVGVLFDGQLVAEGTPEEIKTRAEMGDDDGSLEDAFLEITSGGRQIDPR
jgi:ABC-2 type transport system ATP-binding protein